MRNLLGHGGNNNTTMKLNLLLNLVLVGDGTNEGNDDIVEDI
jgi:hypothetical protein